MRTSFQGLHRPTIDASHEEGASVPGWFRAFVDLVADAGFDALDVWTGQLNWEWATEQHR